MSITTAVIIGLVLLGLFIVKKRQRALRNRDVLPHGLRKDPPLGEERGQFSDLDDGILGPARVVGEETAQGESVSEENPVDTYAQQSNPAEAMQNLVIIYVMAKGSDIFMGYDLMQALVNLGLVSGTNGLLDWDDNSEETPRTIFHVASAVEPGAINLMDMATFMTPGLCFFMDISKKESPDKDFALMLDSAKCLADDLNAQIMDFRHERWTIRKEDQYFSHIQHTMMKNNQTANENHWSTH